MRFWDSSAIVPMLVEEAPTKAVTTLYVGDPVTVTWWATEIECASAIARLEREGDLSAQGVRQAFERLRRLAATWHDVQPTPAIREVAVRLLRVHNLRAADAAQLAAAFLVSEHRPPTLEIVSLDDRLSTAAAKEGFRLAHNPGVPADNR